jgi:hypothetical protein
MRCFGVLNKITGFRDISAERAIFKAFFVLFEEESRGFIYSEATGFFKALN